MTELNDRKFTEALLALYGRIVAETRGVYNPIIFRKILQQEGGLGAVRVLIRKGQKEENWARGFHTLWRLGRVDLSLEAFIVENSCWRSWLASLGMQDYVEEAEYRLQKMGYKLAVNLQRKEAGRDISLAKNVAKSNAEVGKQFEKKIRAYWKDVRGIDLRPQFVLPIGVSEWKKTHKFDLGCRQSKIIIECKASKWPKNEKATPNLVEWIRTMQDLSLCPADYSKYFFCLREWNKKRHCTLAEYYSDYHFNKIPSGVEIWEYDCEKHTATRLQLHTS